MRQLFYIIFYQPFVNRIVRNTIKGLKLPIRIPVTGNVSYNLPNHQRFSLATNESCFVAHKLYWDGCLGYEFTPLFIPLVQHCNTFLDIGANIGYFSILARVYNPDITIHAFEPSEGPYHYLQENFKLNRIQKGAAHKIAISNIQGSITFFDVVSKYSYLKYHLNGSSSTQNDEGRNKEKAYQVVAITLDDFVKTHHLPSVDLIKMDTEYTEHLILQAASHTLSHHKPIIISEVYPEIEDAVEAELNKYQYLIYGYTATGLHLLSSFKQAASNYMGAGTFFDRNFFLVPLEKQKWFEQILPVNN